MPKTKSKNKILRGELRVLDVISKNKSYQECADLIFISEETVNTHMRNGRARNNVNSDLALFRIAVEEGLLILTIKNSGLHSYCPYTT